MAGWVTNLYPGGAVQVETGTEFAFKQAPCKIVLHSTETAGFPDYPANKAPQVTVHPRARQWRQHRPLDKPAWALAAPAGSVSTNSMGAIQIEIVAYAASLKDLSGDDLSYLCGFIRFIAQQTGVPIQCSVDFGGPETYGVNGPKRLSAAAWTVYRGILGHQHVPGNSHWDPGNLPMDQWLPLIKGEPAPAPIAPEEYDMLAFGKVGDIATVYVGDGITRRPLNAGEFAAMKFMVENGYFKMKTMDVVVFSDEGSINGGLGVLVKDATVDVGDITVEAEVSEAAIEEISNRSAVKTVAAMPKTLS